MFAKKIDQMRKIFKVIQREGDDENEHCVQKSFNSDGRLNKEGSINNGFVASPAVLKQKTAVICPISCSSPTN